MTKLSSLVHRRKDPLCSGTPSVSCEEKASNRRQWTVVDGSGHLTMQPPIFSHGKGAISGRQQAPQKPTSCSQAPPWGLQNPDAPRPRLWRDGPLADARAAVETVQVQVLRGPPAT
ncbi:hypothetical protein VFPFJ_04475 [Purpureocillium lilacinum]|uniref:Uncharacterized protein n=1 Tax=Purpureocillium lilacinum TaxID=33203 RepID=A0A179H058_PURLI|nr:hypothetical protein VFPFJ_04475 [Purpureocillium lilacinum]OAQ83534.1 hypothetical protein VFPBJ_02302 [Purpureocillium lilacinum]OAQ90316.1 hypothetical protein VFPFJ_04475 [Purpureocillium lilacinum]